MKISPTRPARSLTETLEANVLFFSFGIFPYKTYRRICPPAHSMIACISVRYRTKWWIFIQSLCFRGVGGNISDWFHHVSSPFFRGPASDWWRQTLKFESSEGRCGRGLTSRHSRPWFQEKSKTTLNPSKAMEKTVNSNINDSCCPVPCMLRIHFKTCDFGSEIRTPKDNFPVERKR